MCSTKYFNQEISCPIFVPNFFRIGCFGSSKVVLLWNWTNLFNWRLWMILVKFIIVALLVVKVCSIYILNISILLFGDGVESLSKIKTRFGFCLLLHPKSTKLSFYGQLFTRNSHWTVEFSSKICFSVQNSFDLPVYMNILFFTFIPLSIASKCLSL